MHVRCPIAQSQECHCMRQKLFVPTFGETMPHLFCCGYLEAGDSMADMHEAALDLPTAPVFLAGGWGFTAVVKHDIVCCWGRNQVNMSPPAGKLLQPSLMRTGYCAAPDAAAQTLNLSITQTTT